MAERWLVIDDSTTIQRVIKLAFQDYDVHIAEADSCVDGTRELMRQPPSLVIVDASVAGAQSVQDFVSLRNLVPETPFVILQGSYDSFHEMQFAQAGFQYFLKKPFDGAQLMQVTRQALGRALPPRLGEEGLVPPPPPLSGPQSTERSPKSLREEAKAPAHVPTAAFDLGLSESPRPAITKPAATGPLDIPGKSAWSDPAPKPSLGRSHAAESATESRLGALPLTIEDTYSPALESFAQSRREGSRGAAGLPQQQGFIEPLLREELEKSVRQAVEDYCRKHFASLAREVIGRELERLTQERSRLLVDK